VVVTHGQLAAELLNAAEMIVGDLPGFAAVSIGWHDDVTVARAALAAAIGKVSTPAGVLLLTDMFGGTPANLGLAFLEAGRVEVVTGVNLPMLITLARASDDDDLLVRARKLGEHGRTAIRVASDLLRAEPETRSDS
jgi:PTS system mannose-specific IIA component